MRHVGAPRQQGGARREAARRPQPPGVRARALSMLPPRKAPRCGPVWTPAQCYPTSALLRIGVERLCPSGAICLHHEKRRPQDTYLRSQHALPGPQVFIERRRLRLSLPSRLNLPFLTFPACLCPQRCRDVRIGTQLARGISGGQAKRVNIGIALVTNPRVLFLDEPTSGLDSYTANEVTPATLGAIERWQPTSCIFGHRNGRPAQRKGFRWKRALHISKG